MKTSLMIAALITITIAAPAHADAASEGAAFMKMLTSLVDGIGTHLSHGPLSYAG